jgi:hypothetical protein
MKDSCAQSGGLSHARGALGARIAEARLSAYMARSARAVSASSVSASRVVADPAAKRIEIGSTSVGAS